MCYMTLPIQEGAKIQEDQPIIKSKSRKGKLLLYLQIVEEEKNREISKLEFLKLLISEKILKTVKS